MSCIYLKHNVQSNSMTHCVAVPVNNLLDKHSYFIFFPIQLDAYKEIRRRILYLMTSYIFREARGMYWHTLWDRLCPLCHLPFTLWGGRYVLKEDAPEVLQYWSKQRLLNPWDRVQFRSTSPTVQHSSWHGTIPKNQMEISSSKDYLIFQTLKIGEPQGFSIC